MIQGFAEETISLANSLILTRDESRIEFSGTTSITLSERDDLTFSAIKVISSSISINIFSGKRPIDVWFSEQREQIVMMVGQIEHGVFS
jgi:hypothetical protein